LILIQLAFLSLPVHLFDPVTTGGTQAKDLFVFLMRL